MSAPPQGTRHHIAHILPWPGVGGTEHATLRVMRGVSAHLKPRESGLSSARLVLNPT